MLIAVLSDTHLPRGARRLPDACVERIAEADLLLHAGDSHHAAVLRELESIGPPLVGVHGNVDSAELRELLPAERVVEAGGARIAMLHDAGPARGRLERMRGRFGDAAEAPSSSATRTCRCTSAATTAFRSSIRAARPSAAARRGTRWGWRGSRTGDVSFELVELDCGKIGRPWTSTSSSSAPPARRRARGAACPPRSCGAAATGCSFDCGEGTQRQLMRSVGLVELEELLITHFHADHVLGLPGMLKTFALRQRERELTVYGPRGLRAPVRAAAARGRAG